MYDSIDKQLKEIKSYSKKFSKFIVWGLKSDTHDSFRYIHAGYFRALQSVGLKALWLNDSPENQQYVTKNDFVFTSNRAEKFLPVRSGTYYCFHNSSLDLIHKADPHKAIMLQVYTNHSEKSLDRINEVTFFNRKTRLLVQPWGTDLLPWEFHEPVFTPHSPFVFWAGSIWNNKQNQGNTNEISILKQSLRENRLLFHHLSNAPDWVNAHFIRFSRMAPTIAGKWQVENDYLPCRMWKNVSYGQLGCTNVKKFIEVFNGQVVYSNSIAEIVEKTLSFSKNAYLDLTNEQQDIVKNHTYLQRSLMVFRSYDRN